MPRVRAVRTTCPRKADSSKACDGQPQPSTDSSVRGRAFNPPLQEIQWSRGTATFHNIPDRLASCPSRPLGDARLVEGTVLTVEIFRHPGPKLLDQGSHPARPPGPSRSRPSTSATRCLAAPICLDRSTASPGRRRRRSGSSSRPPTHAICSTPVRSRWRHAA